MDLLNNKLQIKGVKYFVKGTVASTESVNPKENVNSRFQTGPQYYIILNNLEFDSPLNAGLEPEVRELCEATVKARVKIGSAQYGSKPQLSANVPATRLNGRKNEIDFVDLKTMQEAKANFNPATGTPVTLCLDVYTSENAKAEYGHVTIRYSGLVFDDVSKVHAQGASVGMDSSISGLTKVDALKFADDVPQAPSAGFAATASDSPFADNAAPTAPAANNNPFANNTAPAANSNPFADNATTAPAVNDNPFAGNAPTSDNPFAGNTTATASDNPFA